MPAAWQAGQLCVPAEVGCPDRVGTGHLWYEERSLGIDPIHVSSPTLAGLLHPHSQVCYTVEEEAWTLWVRHLKTAKTKPTRTPHAMLLPEPWACLLIEICVPVGLLICFSV